MSKWIKCDDYKKLPIGEWLVKINKDRNPYHIACVTENSGGSKIVIVGSYFSWDRGDLIAYTAFEKYEDD